MADIAYCSKFMCGESINNQEDARMWLIANAPDKNPNADKELFMKVRECYKARKWCADASSYPSSAISASSANSASVSSASTQQSSSSAKSSSVRNTSSSSSSEENPANKSSFLKKFLSQFIVLLDLQFGP